MVACSSGHSLVKFVEVGVEIKKKRRYQDDKRPAR
jgi:hypothetical protein